MTKSTAENKAVVQDYMSRYWGQGDVTAVDDHCSSGFEMDYPLVPGVQGKDAAKAAIRDLHALFSNFAFHPVGPLVAENVTEGEFVFVRITGGGKHTGGSVPKFFAGSLPANTGKDFKITGMAAFQLKDGKIEREIGEEGALTALQQLGVVPIV